MKANMTVEKTLKLIHRLTDKLNELKGSIDDQVCKAAFKYAMADPSKHGNPSHAADFGNRWDVENPQTVSCKWEDSWSYGGYDDGEIYVPIVFIYDEQALDQYVQKCTEDRLSKEEQQRELELRNKKKLFEKLKKELGED